MRFVQACDGSERFILICSDLSLSAADIIRVIVIGSRSKSALKHLIRLFFYRFWTNARPRIGKGTESDLSAANDVGS